MVDTQALWGQSYEDLDGVVIPRLSLSAGTKKRYRLLIPIHQSPAALIHEFRNEGSKFYTTGLCWNNPKGPHHCPLCLMGRLAKPHVFLLFWSYESDTPRVEVWERTKSFVRKNLVLPYEDTGVELLRQDVQIIRIGEGKTTSYSITPVPANPRFVFPTDDQIQQEINAIDWAGLLEGYPTQEQIDVWMARERGEVDQDGAPTRLEVGAPVPPPMDSESPFMVQYE